MNFNFKVKYQNFQYEAYRKDGIKIWLEENTRVVYNSQGEITLL